MAADGKEGLARVEESVDLIVLDLMLPEVDGLSVCRQIRSDNEYKNIPIIMLTAKGEEVDKVIGLEMGADDYMAKPFSPRELIARIKAICRRVTPDKDSNSEGNKKNEIITIGEIELNVDSHEILKDGNTLNLTPKEFELAKILIVNINKVLTRDLLLEKIWGYQYAGDTRTVDVHIRRLRKKIGKEYIKTVRGVGYKFVEME
jgi:two-component system alkaline phosphatase synthesis response regulator PhoP